MLIVRVGGMPGAFPIYPELIERSTQTDVSLPCMSSLDDDDMSQATANTTAVAQLLTLPSTASQGSSLSASDTSLNQRRLLSTKLSASGLSGMYE